VPACVRARVQACDVLDESSSLLKVVHSLERRNHLKVTNRNSTLGTCVPTQWGLFERSNGRTVSSKLAIAWKSNWASSTCLKAPVVARRAAAPQGILRGEWKQPIVRQAQLKQLFAASIAFANRNSGMGPFFPALLVSGYNEVDGTAPDGSQLSGMQPEARSA
jgi:hypothetical protein